jgi:hypothetical protein
MKDLGEPSPAVVADGNELSFKCVLFLRLRAMMSCVRKSGFKFKYKFKHKLLVFFHLMFVRMAVAKQRLSAHKFKPVFSMSRLASFRGPSTPSASPVQSKQPSSPSRITESTYHRKLRTLLQELRSITQTWDDLVLVDGLKAATNLVDTRTDLE